MARRADAEEAPYPPIVGGVVVRLGFTPLPLQPRRLIIVFAAVGCKRLLGSFPAPD